MKLKELKDLQAILDRENNDGYSVDGQSVSLNFKAAELILNPDGTWELRKY